MTPGSLTGLHMTIYKPQTNVLILKPIPSRPEYAGETGENARTIQSRGDSPPDCLSDYAAYLLAKQPDPAEGRQELRHPAWEAGLTPETRQQKPPDRPSQAYPTTPTTHHSKPPPAEPVPDT